MDYEKRNTLKITVLGEDVDGNKVFNNFTISVNDLNETTSISDLESMTESIQISPNPGFGIFKIQFAQNVLSNGPKKAEIYNMNGSRVTIVELKTLSQNEASVDLSGLPDGIYLLELQTGNQKIAKKLIVHR